MSVEIDLICWSSCTINYVLHFTSILFFMNLYMYTHMHSKTWWSFVIEFFFSSLLQDFMWAWLLRWSISICLNRSLSGWASRFWWIFDSDDNCFQWNDFNSCQIFMTSFTFFLIIKFLMIVGLLNHLYDWKCLLYVPS